MNLVIIGASAGLGKALCFKLAEKGHNLLIVASNEDDLSEQADDLKIRFKVKVEIAALRVRCENASVEAIREKAARLGEIQGVLFPIGYSRDDDDGTLSAEDTQRIVSSNFSAIMAITGSFLPDFIKQTSGVFVYFGSVASERGRSSNICYAAAKRGLKSYYESIRHKTAASNIKVQYYQLGYLKTAQTLGKKLPFPAAEPDKAAAFIVSRLVSESGERYYPGFWRFICLALRLTPWFVFKKLKF